MRSALLRVGEAAGVILPQAVLDSLDLKLADSLNVEVRGGEVVVTAANRKVREGWEEDFRALAEESRSVVTPD